LKERNRRLWNLFLRVAGFDLPGNESRAAWPGG